MTDRNRVTEVMLEGRVERIDSDTIALFSGNYARGTATVVTDKGAVEIPLYGAQVVALKIGDIGRIRAVFEREG